MSVFINKSQRNEFYLSRFESEQFKYINVHLKINLFFFFDI